MEVFGLTPIDAALSARGLYWSYQISQFIFIQTPLGLLSCVIGFLYSVLRSGQQANFKYFSIFAFIAISGALLFILPNRQVSVIKSAVEVFGQTINESGRSTDSLNIDYLHISVLLSFLSQLIDSISWGALSLMDSSLAKPLRFLNDPFSIHKLSLRFNEWQLDPITDIHLQRDLNDFYYAHFIPSLIKYQKQHGDLQDTHLIWPGHLEILRFYSNKERTEWDSLKRRVLILMNGSSDEWRQMRALMPQLELSLTDLEDQVVADSVTAVNRSARPLWLSICSGMLMSFPYVYGAVSACLFLAWPLLMVVVVITSRLSLLLTYLGGFIWVKSWVFCAALSYYVSLMVLHVQAEGALDFHWFWEYPYYLAIGSGLLILLPIFSLLIIYQGFQWVSHR